MKNYKNVNEICVTISVCIIFMLRMLGMFMLTPAMHTTGILLFHANKVLIGIAIGIYGLMQSIFQIPFGFLSNKIGYKHTIGIVLLFFFLGSLVLCISHSIFGIIFGRALQGIGTVSSVFMALLSNIIKEQNYSKVISCVGVSFAISFLFSIILGPIVIQYIGLYGLFYLILLASILCIIITFYYVFPYCDSILHYKMNKIVFYQSNIFIKKYDIFGYIASIFFLHFLLMVNFIIFPKNMELLGYILNQHFEIYGFIIFFSLLVVYPIIILAEKKRYVRFSIISSIYLIVISLINLLIFKINFFIFLININLFFISFILCETFLPSLLSRMLSVKNKNIIMSIYSTSQFLGTALGSILSGIIYQYLGIASLIMLNIIVSVIWLLLFFFISRPVYIFSTSIIPKKICTLQSDIINLLKKNRSGIISIEYSKRDNILFIKFDTQKININIIKRYIEYK